NSYVNGILGRGVSNGGGLVEFTFPVGEGMKYRPITFNMNAPSNSTGHYLWVQMVSGDANTGSSTFTGGIDKVSELRYYEAGYLQNSGSASSEAVFGLSPTYSTDDSVIAGNQDLRVAYSVDNRATWNDAGPTDHTTDLTNVPTTIASDSLDPNITIDTGSSFFVSLAFIDAQIVSAADGGWNEAATWVGGVVPGATDNVVIDHTVTLDVTDAACNDLTINDKLRFAVDGTVSGITVDGNITINAGGLLRVESLSASGPFIEHTLNLKGDLTNNGTLDFRGGSNGSGTSNAVLITFDGTTNSTVSLSNTSYSSSGEEFNSITINKTGGAKVILAAGNLYTSNNSSTGGVVLTLTEGIIETGTNHWVFQRTGSSGIDGGSDNSHINGILGRGVSNGGGQVEFTFPLGDGTKYRPITFDLNAPSNATGHYFWAQMISGDANTGSSTFTGGIDKVSELRYYEAGYLQNNGSASSELAYKLSPTYSTDDGVIAGNLDLRVAYSSDNRATWNGIGPLDHVTDLTNVPTTIASDSLDPNISISTGTSIFISLARAAGTTTNPLPVELTSFSANLSGNNIMLSWTTATELNNKGFEIEKSLDNSTFSVIGFVNGFGTTTEKKYYSFVDENTSSGTAYYRLKQIDFDGSVSYSQVVSTDGSLPTQFELKQNYPNPFNPSTRISYSVNESGLVKLSVYNLLGEVVDILVNQNQEAGFYNVQFDASNLQSGVYFYKLESGNQVETKKMMLLK
ncbi:MAG: T9SS type A sorting domain-containing protein, partial [Candidatus Marinimicrobia bacterium]|nr:T9SS type A sorting domain-containing protein [Candidatus Neomarinimicrobiota bacterium]